MAVETRKPGEVAIAFALNGSPVELAVRQDEKLLETQRERCGIVSPKNACIPQGGCGACTVLVTGQPTLSCVLPARSVHGKEVRTLEGLSERERAARRAGIQHSPARPGARDRRGPPRSPSRAWKLR